MKIVYLSGNVLPSRAANTVHVMRMCAAFAQLGHEVTLLTGGCPEGELKGMDPFEYYGTPETFRIVHLRRWQHPGNEYLWGVRAALFTKIHRPDLVYGRSMLGCYYSAKVGLPTVYEPHRPDTEHRRGKTVRAARLLINSRLIRLVVLSQALADRFRQDFSFPYGKMIIAYNGADDGATTANASSDATRNELLRRIPENWFRVGYVGSLYPGKGFEMVSTLARRCDWAQFYVAGGSSEEIERATSTNGGKIENLHFLGHLSQSEVMELRRKMDVLLVPPKKRVAVSDQREIEQAYAPPLKLFESLATGKPIICSSFLDEVVADGQDALLCDEENPDQWEEALRSLYNTPGLREKLARAAREKFDSGFSWSARASRVLNNLDIVPAIKK